MCLVINDLGTDLDGSGEDPEPAETTAASIREAAGEEVLKPQRSFVAVRSRGRENRYVGQLNYSTAKACLLEFTRSASSELFDVDVRVNAVMPSGFMLQARLARCIL